MSFSSVRGEVMVEAEKIAANGNYRVNFALKADKCAAVSLVGSFNDWDTGVLMMKWSETDAMFVCQLELAPGYYEYKFEGVGENARCFLSVLLTEQYGDANRSTRGDHTRKGENHHNDGHYQIYGGKSVLTDKPSNEQSVSNLIERTKCHRNH